MDLGLAGRACVVTGASSGIGFEVARQLRGEGAGVLLVARGEERLEVAVRRIDAEAEGSGMVATVALDITDADAGERMLAAAHDRLGGVDVLVTTLAPPGGETSSTSPTRTGASSTSST